MKSMLVILAASFVSPALAQSGDVVRELAPVRVELRVVQPPVFRPAPPPSLPQPIRLEPIRPADELDALAREVSAILQAGRIGESAEERAFREAVEALGREVAEVLSSGTIGRSSVTGVLSSGTIGNATPRYAPTRPSTPTTTGVPAAAPAGAAGAGLSRD